LFFAPDDPIDLARQLQRLIDEPELLSRLAEAIAPVRTLDDEMHEIVDLYHTVVQRHASLQAAGAAGA